MSRKHSPPFDVFELLDSFAARTPMYVQPVSVETVQSFLAGLECGCALGGLDVSVDARAKAAALRGWELLPSDVLGQMRARGFSDDAVIRELIAIQAEVFRKAAAEVPADRTHSLD
ncbi:MAG: hypothetical protein IT428_17440 [Planctomycetaceae bacterium]|nr:hypothetical protein [Planctomycetaceae bacterium]